MDTSKEHVRVMAQMESSTTEKLSIAATINENIKEHSCKCGIDPFSTLRELFSLLSYRNWQRKVDYHLTKLLEICAT